MVDIDVTQEILSLSQGGVGALKELLKLSGIILLPVSGEVKKKVKKVFTPKGIVNFKDFAKVSEGMEIEFRELDKPLDIELLNEAMKKFEIACYLEEDTNVGRIHYTKDKMMYINMALKHYEKRLLEKTKINEQYSEEKEGMTESQAENVRKNNRTADELFFMDGKQQAPFMDSILSEDKKSRINEAQLHAYQQSDKMSASEVKQTLNPPDGLSGKDVHIGGENKSLNQVLNKIRLTGDVSQDRSNIAQKIRREIAEEEGFISLRNDKLLCFRDNDDHLVVMNMEDYTMKVSNLSELPEEKKERVQNLMELICEQKKNIEMDLNMTLPDNFPESRKKFVQEMYECCILHTEISKNDVNAIRNFMTLMEDKKELTWKDVLLWEAAKSGQFEYSMVKLDAEQIENIFAAKVSGIPDKYIQYMIRYDFSADQMRGTIDVLREEGNVSMEEMSHLASDIEGRQEKIKEALVKGYTESASERKQTFEDVKDHMANEKFKYMETDEKGISQAAEFVTVGKEPDHVDENGRWFEAYRNPYGDRIFVNEDKTEIKYEVRVDSETLSPEQKKNLEKQDACYQDAKGVRYYKDRGNLVSENGKTVKQKRMSYQAKEFVQKDAGDINRTAERKADKGR